MNRLSKESSPYLLQHKNNPVDWYTWSDEAWATAKRDNKIVIVSIGYSSCHWCHVMEHEVFEDYECAEIMNRNFICIKVDREERPDVDSIYMDAVHLMGSKGGWPLNVFTLPDGRPVYGGTYFPKQHWISILENLSELHANEPGKMLTYAERLHQGIRQLNIISPESDKQPLEIEFIDKVVEHWTQYWDLSNGGSNKAPKFPMPGNLAFLLGYASLRADMKSLDYVFLTLKKMAMGGIYDQAGGGFSRYSVDEFWKVPHFEKMLYDNAQLAALYAQAFRVNKDFSLKEVFTGILQWANREMKSPEGLYYSALDADSEGVEGRFYTWTKDEIERVAGDDHKFACDYYCIDKEAHWEEGQNILLKKESDLEFASRWNTSVEDIRERVNSLNSKLLFERSKRIRPGLDNKCITSWNAMMVVAFCEAYQSTGEDEYAEAAMKLFDDINRLCRKTDGTYYHIFTSGTAHISAFHDDYAWLAQAAIDLFEISSNQKYIEVANDIVNLCFTYFFNENNGLFFFTNAHDTEQLSRRVEIQDNVTPASNSVMCKVLFRLSIHLGNQSHKERSEKMLRNILPRLDYASGYTNWLSVYCMLTFPYHELVVAGPDAKVKMKQLMLHFIPNASFAASTIQSELPLLKGRFDSQTAIYVCTDNTCHLPELSVDMAMSHLK